MSRAKYSHEQSEYELINDLKAHLENCWFGPSNDDKEEIWMRVELMNKRDPVKMTKERGFGVNKADAEIRRDLLLRHGRMRYLVGHLS